MSREPRLSQVLPVEVALLSLHLPFVQGEGPSDQARDPGGGGWRWPGDFLLPRWKSAVAGPLLFADGGLLGLDQRRRQNAGRGLGVVRESRDDLRGALAQRELQEDLHMVGLNRRSK